MWKSEKDHKTQKKNEGADFRAQQQSTGSGVKKV
jgi:hypothetical protein